MIIADKMTYHDILESGIKEGIFVTSANKDAITKKICWNDNISEVKKKMCLEYKKKKKTACCRSYSIDEYESMLRLKVPYQKQMNREEALSEKGIYLSFPFGEYTKIGYLWVIRRHYLN